MTDYRAVFPILAMQNIVQKCSHFAYDYCRRFFLCFQAQALTVRNLQHLRNRPFAQVLWSKYCVLMIPHRSTQPYVPNPAGIRAVSGWLILGRHTVTPIRLRRSRIETKGRTRRKHRGLGPSGMGERRGKPAANVNWMRSRCAACARNTRGSWQRWRTMLSRTRVSMLCSGSVRCSRCARIAIRQKSSG